MIRLSSLISNFRFGSRKFKSGLSRSKKKSYMLEIMNDVGSRLDSSSFEFNDSSVDKINSLKSEFKDVSQKKKEATGKLSESQSKLKSLTETSEQLSQKSTKLDKEVKGLACILYDLETKDRELKDEKALDSEIEELKSKVSDIEREMAPSVEQQNKLDDETGLLVEKKTTLNKELSSGSEKLDTLRKDVPALVNKKVEVENLIRSSKEIQQKYSEVEEVCDKLKSENEELGFEVQKSRQELDSLVETKTTLSNELSSVSVELNTLRKDVPALAKKKDQTERRIQLSNEIHQRYEEAKEERDRLDSEFSRLEAAIQDNRPELSSLAETRATLSKELSLASVELNAIRKDVQFLTNKKSETERRIQLSKGIHQRYEEAKGERDKLDSEIGELETEIQGSRPELSSLVEMKSTLNKELLSASGLLNALRKDVPNLTNKKSESEKRIQLSKGIHQRYEEFKEEREKLNNENSELEATVATGRQELKDSKNKLVESQGMFKKLQGDKGTLDDKIEKLNIRKDKVDSLNTDMEPVVNERDELANRLTGMEAFVNKIREDKSGLEQMKQDKVSLQQEFENLKEKTKQITDSLESLARSKENSEKAKVNYEKVAGRIALRREGIQAMEVRACSYKKAFEELAGAVIGQ
ncbi:MAG: hypothetical protein ACUZ8E_02620 [Candidatus Anammoxibacter sp.]